jgi:hypothetical protein
VTWSVTVPPLDCYHPKKTGPSAPFGFQRRASFSKRPYSLLAKPSSESSAWKTLYRSR